MRIDPGSDYWKGVIGLAVIAAICIAVLGMLFASGRLNKAWFTEHPIQISAIVILLLVLVVLIIRMIKVREDFLVDI